VDQAAAPLHDGLLAYVSRGLTGFHTPGHVGGRAFDLSRLLELDLTEVPLRPGGSLTPALVGAAEAVAADLFGAGYTFFLTNGASIGVLAMLLGACRPGGEILAGRDCHRAVVNACILGDLRPVFLEPVLAAGWRFPIGVATARLQEALTAGPPVLATNPTYQGVVWDLRPLGSNRGTLLVDEAHGAHLAFGAGGCGARTIPAWAWVHGCHKTLGSLTQTAMLHVGPDVPPEPCADWLERLGSTSPSYPLLASLDQARRWAATSGRVSWERAGDAMPALRARLTDAGLRVLRDEDLPNGARTDPAKLTVAAPDGYMAARLLHERWHLQVEAAGNDWLTFLITPFHTENELVRLRSGLVETIPTLDTGTGLPAWPVGLPERTLWPRAASISPRQRVPLGQMVGRVAAEPLCPYPPGIPLVWPGEVIDEEIARFVRVMLSSGGMVTGVDQAGTVAVVAA